MQRDATLNNACKCIYCSHNKEYRIPDKMLSLIAEEKWAHIPFPGTEGYLVSDLGRVRAKGKNNHAEQNVLIYTGKTLTPTLRDGYPRVRVNGKNYTVHRLVAAAFLGPCPEGMEVRHLDGNRLNNRADNLAYGTHRENILDQYNTRGYLHSGMTREQAIYAAGRILAGDDPKIIAEALEVPYKTIRDMVAGNTYRWAMEAVKNSVQTSS